MNKTSRYHLNDTVENFTVKKATAIDELDCVAYELIHNKTKARVIQLENKDTENTFVISLQTST